MATKPLYVQHSLLPPEAVTATLRIGVVGASNHVQIDWSVQNATDGELLGMAALPHRSLDQLPAEAAHMLQELLEAVRQLVVPF